ncbi:hypothetical protein Q7P37_001202 [Cladosporium fusiforme]
MNSKSLRRLAADHGALHNNPLPPNFLFPPTAADTDDLTELDILLAGPLHTPFSSGVWKLHLTIPPEYPQSPPTANFRTPIFHPNVDPQSGGVCVETLKRDWDAKLTLRDVLVTISCLLIQPNPDSALNAEAGALIQEGFEVFERRARLMTSINAGIPRALSEGVREAQTRGQESEVREDEPERTLLREEDVDSVCKPPAPVRRKRGVARLRSAAASRRSDGSPSGAVGMRRQQQQPGPSSSRPFVTQSSSSGDPFGISIREDPPLGTPQLDPSSDDEDDDDNDNGSTTSADQENDTAFSPSRPRATPSKPTTGTPRRPHGAPPVPLGELTLSDPEPSSDDEEAEDSDMEPDRTAALFGPGARNFTPPNALSQPLATDSPYAGTGGDTTIEDVTMAEPSPSPRKARSGGRLFQTPAKKGGEVRSLFGWPVAAGLPGGGVPKPRSPPSSAERRRARDKRLWELCGGDVRKWNRGEFEGESFPMKAARW